MGTGSSSEIRDIVSQFVGQLSTLIEQDAVSRAREVILSAFSGAEISGVGARGRRGRPAAGIMASAAFASGRPAGRRRRKAPIQLCPVPGCTNRAAPVFGMVCAKHKDLPKSEIKKYREARRAQRKAAAKGPGRASAAAAKAKAKAA
jgi:hypothetical protein